MNPYTTRRDPEGDDNPGRGGGVDREQNGDRVDIGSDAVIDMGAAIAP